MWIHQSHLMRKHAIEFGRRELKHREIKLRPQDWFIQVSEHVLINDEWEWMDVYSMQLEDVVPYHAELAEYEIQAVYEHNSEKTYIPLLNTDDVTCDCLKILTQYQADLFLRGMYEDNTSEFDYTLWDINGWTFEAIDAHDNVILTLTTEDIVKLECGLYASSLKRSQLTTSNWK